MQDRVSSPAKDRRSANCATQLTRRKCLGSCLWGECAEYRGGKVRGIVWIPMQDYKSLWGDVSFFSVRRYFLESLVSHGESLGDVM